MLGWGLPLWLSGQGSTCNAGAAGDAGSIPGLGRSLGGGNGNRFQHSCQENPTELVGYSPQGCKESDMTEVI